MKKLLLVPLLFTVACLPEEIEASRATGTVCIQYVPHTDNDPEGVLFENWSDRRKLDYNEHRWTYETVTVGWSEAENSPIWNTLECTGVK